MCLFALNVWCHVWWLTPIKTFETKTLSFHTSTFKNTFLKALSIYITRSMMVLKTIEWFQVAPVSFIINALSTDPSLCIQLGEVWKLCAFKEYKEFRHSEKYSHLSAPHWNTLNVLSQGQVRPPVSTLVVESYITKFEVDIREQEAHFKIWYKPMLHNAFLFNSLVRCGNTEGENNSCAQRQHP